jgi:hypothetical protein
LFQIRAPAAKPTESTGLLDFLSIRSAYVFELPSREKVADPYWLISATPPEINHLQASARKEATTRPAFKPD